VRKHNYVVGYKGENQCVYGRGDEWTDLLTFAEANKRAKELKTGYGKRIYRGKVFKLVEVKQT